MRNVLILALAVLFYSVNAQCDNLDSIYFSSFANSSDTSGWLIIDNNADNNTWKVKQSFFDTTLSYNYSSVSNANDWAFSQCISMNNTYAYSLRFDCKASNDIEKLMVLITSAQDTGSIVDTLYDLDSIYWTSPQIFDTSFNISASGDYHIAFWAHSEKDKSQLDIDDIRLEKQISTKIPETNTGIIKIFPNPADDILHLSLSDEVFTTIYIFDLLGKLVKTTFTNKKLTKLDISNLDRGVYNIAIISDKTNQTKRLTIF